MPSRHFGTAQEYANAIRSVLSEGVPESHIELLRSHFEASESTATTRQLAREVGFKTFGGANMQYGQFAHRIARRLGVDEAPRGFWLFVLAEWAPGQARDQDTKFVLRKPVQQALKLVGFPWASTVAPRAASHTSAMGEKTRYWVVKGRPAENDFDSWLKPNRRDKWRTASPPAAWAAGDRLFFWKSAPELSVVGLGELLTPERRRQRGVDTWFHVRYLGPTLTRPIGIGELRRDRLIGDASFLKSGPAGTVFPLTAVQGTRLFALVRQHNRFVTDIWPDLTGREPNVNDVDLLDGREGSRRLVEHVRLERDRRLVEAKKRQALQSGTLECEVCAFDFATRYGEIGRGFCEVHHRESLSRSGPTRTTLRDLAVVCSNCHRMLHRPGFDGSIEVLRRALRHEA